MGTYSHGASGRSAFWVAVSMLLVSYVVQVSSSPNFLAYRNARSNKWRSNRRALHVHEELDQGTQEKEVLATWTYYKPLAKHLADDVSDALSDLTHHLKHVAKNYGENEQSLQQLHTCTAQYEPSARPVCRLQEERQQLGFLLGQLDGLLRLDSPSCASGHCWPRCAIFRHHTTRGHVGDAFSRSTREIAALGRLLEQVAPHGNAGCTPRVPRLPAPIAACTQRDFLRATLETIACIERLVVPLGRIPLNL